MVRSDFAIDDLLQQMMGVFLLAGPFVVPEEVWALAENRTPFHLTAAIAIVIRIGYGGLFHADNERDPDDEDEVAGIPLRFISLLAVSYGLSSFSC
jgi:uncharacterized membrane protein